MPYSQDQVYVAKYLYFATKDTGREPTLYFRTDHGSGRLRQEHPNGPKIQEIRKHVSHAFFSRKEDHDNFASAIRKLKKENMTRQMFRNLRSLHHGGNRPIQDRWHYEATFNGHDAATTCHTTHKSGGKVLSAELTRELGPQVEAIYSGMKVA